MKHFFNLSVLGTVAGFLFLFAPALPAHAATFYLSLDKAVTRVGDTVVATVRIDGEGAEFNAAQTTLRFPKDILQVDRIDFSKSIFTFWLANPSFSNENGTADFIGGSAAGFSGRSLGVYFRVKGTGVAELTFNDSAITASDGSGTNILSSVQGAKVTVPVTASEAASLVVPVQISRPVISATKLPPAPAVRVPLYLNNGRWNNLSAPFYVEWDLPADVTDVAAVVDKNPVFSPAKSEGLFVSKRFDALQDGVYFAHVRFRNSMGWGPTAHYRIALDTTPPAPFDITFEDRPSLVEPHRVGYATGDALSGVERFELSVNGGDRTVSTSTKGGYFSIARHLPPGTHMVEVHAYDKAGNVTTAGLRVDIAAIESPVVTLVADHIHTEEGEGGPVLIGSSVPNATLTLTIVQSWDEVPRYQQTVMADSLGRWTAVFDQSLGIGDYFVEVVATNERGEMSYPVRSEIFSVRKPPLFSLWGFDIYPAWFWSALFFLFLVVGAGGRLFDHVWHSRLSGRVVIAERDLFTFRGIIDKDLAKLSYLLGKGMQTASERTEAKFLIDKIRKNVQKVGKYVRDNIRDIAR
jgi:predicted secreted protein